MIEKVALKTLGKDGVLGKQSRITFYYVLKMRFKRANLYQGNPYEEENNGKIKPIMETLFLRDIMHYCCDQMTPGEALATNGEMVAKINEIVPKSSVGLSGFTFGLQGFGL